MKQLKQTILHWLIQWFLILSVLITAGVVFAVNSWDTLTATMWNDLVTKVSPITNNSWNIELSWELTRSITYFTWNWPVDNLDDWQIVSRVLNFTKKSESTVLRINYTDNFRAWWTGRWCRWEVKIDGGSCTQPLLYDYFTWSDNILRSQNVVWYCSGISAWSHQIQVWVTDVPWYPSSDCYTWWNNSTWVIDVEEVN